MRAVRTLLIAAVFAVGIGVPGARACSLQIVQQPGETRAEANQRFRRDYQDRLWADADVVFVDEVRTLTSSGSVLEAEIIPRGALRGEIGAEPIVYHPLDHRVGITCGTLSLPTVTFPGVYYASRAADGQLHVDGMLNAEDIKDEALRERLYRQLGMEPIPQGVSEADQLPLGLPHWAWLAGTAGLSLISGISIGRASRRAPSKQKPRP